MDLVYFVLHQAGEIMQVGSAEVDHLATMRPGCEYILVDRHLSGEEIDSLYVSAGELHNRSELVDVQDEYVWEISDKFLTIPLPAGSAIRSMYNDTIYRDQDGIEFHSAVIGTFHFDITPPARFKRRRITIHAVHNRSDSE
jgi:hypothetical protein